MQELVVDAEEVARQGSCESAPAAAFFWTLGTPITTWVGMPPPQVDLISVS